MKAVLLVGGKGTRLRPLTYRIPKPLIPVMGKPLMMHVIDSLPAEVDETIIPVGYMRETMEAYLKEHPPSRKITIVEEKEPMGTGGAVKNVEDYIDGDFLVINGDSISSLDMRRFIEYHRSKKAFATISLWEVEDPTPFGVVDMDVNGKIHRFQEKPTRQEAFSLLINAGAYALSYETLDHIDEGFVSMERQVFPRILDRGMYGMRFEGYWVDCGTRENLLDAYRTLMKANARGGEGPDDGRVIADRAAVERGASVEGSSIGPFTYISRGTVVEPGSHITGSVLFEDVRIGPNCRIIDSIVDQGVVVPGGSVIESQILGAVEQAVE
ncbi:MAG: NDP-sugar synthase [Thermoplasmata archaeon]|nr:NDP-sugar synthase [Thermoplasmata archaeon]